MRILFYNHASEISGAERGLIAIMRQAQAAEHTVELCAPAGPLVREAAQAGIAVLPIAPLELGYTHNPLVLTGYIMRAAVPLAALVRAVRHCQPDIVHANSIRAGLIAVGALRFVQPRPRLVVHMRDALHDEALNRPVAMAIGKHSDAVVAISHFVARGIPLAAGKVHVLHNAIDPDRYCRDLEKGQILRRRLRLSLDAPVLAVVGQLTPWKGQMDALDAFALLRTSCPAAHLLIAGAAKFVGTYRRYDTTAYQQALVARAQRPDLHGHVHFLGDVADVAAVYSAATLLVVPSWSEPFGRVVIEAMAAGCPVLATHAGGIPEIVTHGADGWLVPPRDPEALAAAMAHLLGDPALREQLAGHGISTVRERFSLSDYGARMEALWTSLIQPAGQS